MSVTQEKAAPPQTRKKTNLDWQARASLRKRIDDPDWDWECAERYERHAINAILDMEEVEAVNKELLGRCEKMRWFLDSEAHEWTHEDDEKLDAAIAKARGR